MSATPEREQAEALRWFVARNRQQGVTHIMSYTCLSLDVLEALVEREREVERLTRALESVRDVFPQGVCSRCAGFEFEVEEANRIIDKALAGGVSHD